MKDICMYKNGFAKATRRWCMNMTIIVGLLMPAMLYAHQTPNAIVLLDLNPYNVTMELQLPLSELELAFGKPLSKKPETVVSEYGEQLKEYLEAHIHAGVANENPWVIQVNSLRMDKGEQVLSGPPFWELNAQVTLIPPRGVGTRQFMLHYDVIMHQVINHTALVSIRSDWAIGAQAHEQREIGVIRRDLKDNVIHPFEISLATGSLWKGFTSMCNLGMQHIKEGMDHLLFLIVLLLPAMLFANGSRWGKYGGIKYSIVHLLQIVTAFTIGHSITLLVGAMGWIKVPAQPVEILIACSILVSAFHAIRPIFPGREAYVAGGFGLIHGLAFASFLSNLHLSAGTMALSILGFDIGIECMQLLIIVMIVPWLIILSQIFLYKCIRISGAVVAALAAIGWIAERVSGHANFFTIGITMMSHYAIYITGALVIGALLAYVYTRKNTMAVYTIE